eukprot:CAMPEP_0181293748 /NCGR_PEP_ID=MMETSP1101-20121128/3227_1 /TAXON_ID=46948 /ORGANISM="Rhodomonas abbreviata, Strain Caron Lab Isolate" /LENGTH=380 /DNA_ID=CAMNT_0023398349 /DNA_START=132 /DNA_END=1270 /DNA_ORIENTATION=+
MFYLTRARPCSFFSECRVVLLAAAACPALSGGSIDEEGGITADDPEVFILSFDKNGDQKLNLEEYSSMIASLNQDDDYPAEEAFWYIDTTGDELLDFDEIVAWLLPPLEGGTPACAADAAKESEQPAKEERKKKQRKMDESEAKLHAEKEKRRNDPAFADVPPEYWGDGDEETHDHGDPTAFAMTFDNDGDGFVSFEEFQEMMGDDSDSSEVEQFFEQGDSDKNGKLDEAEIFRVFFGATPMQQERSRPGEAESPPIEHHQAQNVPDSTAVDSKVLYKHATSGDPVAMEQALKSVYSVDGGAEEGECTPLHVALSHFDVWNHNRHLEFNNRRNYTAVALLLVEGGADLTLECEGQTPLLAAVQVRNSPVALAIIHALHTR